MDDKWYRMRKEVARYTGHRIVGYEKLYKVVSRMNLEGHEVYITSTGDTVGLEVFAMSKAGEAFLPQCIKEVEGEGSGNGVGEA